MKTQGCDSARKRLERLLVIIALTLSPVATLAGAKDQKNRAQTQPAALQYTREVYLGTSSLRLPGSGACIYLGAFFSSDDFFEGLSLLATPSGSGFHKQDHLVETFPDTLLIEVRGFLGLTGCELSIGKTTNEQSKLGPKPTAASSESSPSTTDLKDVLRFEVALVRGSSTMPAELISTNVRESSSPEVGPRRWNFEILIRSKQAPLIDQVHLTVLSQNGQLLTRITGGLDTPMNRILYSPKVPKPKHGSAAQYPEWWDR